VDEFNPQEPDDITRVVCDCIRETYESFGQEPVPERLVELLDLLERAENDQP
jgi:hypothetical protein